jgi:hypothetical protein
VVDDEAQLSMDCRIKSANDEDGASFRDKRIAHAVRESRSRSRTWIHLVQSRLRLLANYTSDVVAGLVRIVTALLPRRGWSPSPDARSKAARRRQSRLRQNPIDRRRGLPPSPAADASRARMPSHRIDTMTPRIGKGSIA